MLKLSYGDTLYFGKYKGSRIDDILETDPEYLAWCVENVKGFCLDDEIVDQVLGFIEDDYNNFYEEYYYGT